MTPLRARLRDALGQTEGRGHARARLLAAAVRVVAECGVVEMRVEDVLQAADVSRRTFYQHFTDKQAVVHALFELVTEHLAATFAAAAAAHPRDPARAIDEALSIYLELHRTDRDIVRALLHEALRSESPLYSARMRFRRAIAATLERALGVAPLVAVGLVSAVEGISLELLEQRSPDLAAAHAAVTQLIARV